MTSLEPIEHGDTELAAPTETDPSASRASDLDDTALDGDDVVRTTTGTRPSNLVILLAGILVVALANVVVGWFALGATTQLRDQYTSANGLQRCLITAQLNENSTTDPSGTAYKAAVQTCLRR